MKKAISLVIVMALIFSVMSFPLTTSATENTTPTEKVHFDWNFEDYTETNDRLPKSTSGEYGAFTTPIAGGVKSDWDGNAFYMGDVSPTFNYIPETPITSGKLLLSVDLKYNVNSSIAQKSWSIINKNNDTEERVYLLSFENPQDTYGASIYTGNGATWRKDKLLTAEPNKIYTIDILIDMEGKTQTYYVDGVVSKEYPLDYTFNLTKFIFPVNSNIECLDNFKLVENPANYTFSSVGTATTQGNYIMVNFSDSVDAKATDFVIDEGSVTVTSVEKISGRMFKLKLSQNLTEGTHTVALVDTNLKSAIGTTAKNTSLEFNVIKSINYFDMGFENPDNFSISPYFNSFNQYGIWSFVGSAVLTPDNTYRFAGDETNGVTVSGNGNNVASKTIAYELNEPVTSGKLTISFDAAFNSSYPERQYLLCVNSNTDNNAKLLTFGKLYSADNIDTTVISGCKADMHFSGGDLIDFEDNVAYRWDTVIDLDNKVVTNYCNGTAFNSKTITVDTLNNGISSIYFRFMPGIVFFDNFKMTHNAQAFDFKAENVFSDSKTVFVEFGDTLAGGDVSFAFIAPDGNIVTPDKLTKVTPKRYKAEFSELLDGTYKVSVSQGISSVFGTKAGNNVAEFKVISNPEFTATELNFSETEGGVTLSAYLTNTTPEKKKAIFLIGVYLENIMEECAVKTYEIKSCEENILKSVTLTTDKDLSQYTVRGFVWDGESFSPLDDSIFK